VFIQGCAGFIVALVFGPDLKSMSKPFAVKWFKPASLRQNDYFSMPVESKTPSAFDAVDPFLGCEATNLPEPEGIAANWWWPKAQVGNTHPGASFPLGMLSAGAYSGAYPTGYGLYQKNTDGQPHKLFERYEAAGFTHFHQSGTGAIRKYYNYFRVMPIVGGLADMGKRYPLADETAEPGYYACTLDPEDGEKNDGMSGARGVRCELTVGSKAAIHRYTFPEAKRVNIAIDCSRGGIDIPYGSTVPTYADIEICDPGTARAHMMVEGVPLYMYIELGEDHWKQGVWLDKKNVGGGKRLVFDHIRESTVCPFGLHFGGPTEEGQQIEIRLGFSWRSHEQAKANLHDLGDTSFDGVRQQTADRWASDLGRITVEGSSESQREIFYTSLYHSLVKPADGSGESPFWDGNKPFFFDLCTMWDIYKTQIPLLLTVYPERGVDLINALITICEQEGNFPIGYRMARGADRFQGQASALAHVNVVDAYLRDLKGIDWDLALTYMDKDLHRAYGETFMETGEAVHPITHTLDLTYGCHMTERMAGFLGDTELAGTMRWHAARWHEAFDPETGLLMDSTFYEGGKWNYSFRLMHDMAGRIELAGGDEAFTKLLDSFFGYGAAPVKQLGLPPYAEGEMAAGFALNVFEGLNNEPDMETPYNYAYCGRHDRLCEVVRAVMQYAFSTGRGGLPGNDDSGALSSWYVWSAIGLFPVAGQDAVLIGSPIFDAATMKLPEGQLRVVANGNSDEAIYVQSAMLNGELLDRAYLTCKELMAGGELVLKMGTSPSLFGSQNRPPSMG